MNIQIDIEYEVMDGEENAHIDALSVDSAIEQLGAFQRKMEKAQVDAENAWEASQGK